ncbi:response regulator [Roseateles sp. BYS180W]|uniref:Response regulator n=1 Tax=Roseateles rivi TaxID=3299028 RepID=A0ABW7FVE4_9BURK
MISVALVDDHAVVRTGYRRFLELEGMRVALEAADAEAAYAALLAQPVLPEVLIFDLELPGCSGLELTRRVRARWPQARVLVFSMHDDAATVAQALAAGALGFVTKCSAPPEMVSAVREVAAGRRALAADLQQRLQQEPPPQAVLSVREFEVLQALADGKRVEQIARDLCLSPKTVANYQTSIRQKLGVNTPLELLRFARTGKPLLE